MREGWQVFLRRYGQLYLPTFRIYAHKRDADRDARERNVAWANYIMDDLEREPLRFEPGEESARRELYRKLDWCEEASARFIPRDKVSVDWLIDNFACFRQAFVEQVGVEEMEKKRWELEAMFFSH